MGKSINFKLTLFFAGLFILMAASDWANGHFKINRKTALVLSEALKGFL